MTRGSIRHALYRLADWAGIDRSVHPHLFRHQSAIEHLRAGMTLPTLKEMMGHEHISTTQGYLSALSDEDVEAIALRTAPSDNWRL